MTTPLFYHWLGSEAGPAAIEWLTFEQLCREAELTVEDFDE